MDHFSIVDETATQTKEAEPQAIASRSRTTRANGSAIPSVSLGIAAANIVSPVATENGSSETRSLEKGPRFPAEDCGRSLAEMAVSDLDATLQLLADRAQYITGASGAAIALRRSNHNDMLCRASAGTSAPELGSLLSMEYGLSGESVRTRHLLRCDDAERDPRVNREVCRELKIASVVVMPIVSDDVNDDHVLGVFELLSGKPRAFNERDLSALMRLSEMVKSAVKYTLPDPPPPTVKVRSNSVTLEQLLSQPSPKTNLQSRPESPPKSASVEVPQPENMIDAGLAVQAARSAAPENSVEPTLPPEPPKKPLFWSAALRRRDSQQSAEASAAASGISVVPATLRALRQCEACGFPVSQSRTFCVECEEKQWRGQVLGKVADPLTPQPIASPPQPELKPEPKTSAHPTLDRAPALSKVSAIANEAPALPASPVTPSLPQDPSSQAVPANDLLVNDLPANDLPANDLQPIDPSPADVAPAFLSGTMQSESWFAANKYVLIALLLVAITIAAIAWLR